MGLVSTLVNNTINNLETKKNQKKAESEATKYLAAQNVQGTSSGTGAGDYYSTYASGGSSGSSGSASSVTDEERKAAENAKEIAKFNAVSLTNQLAQQRANYDMANEQNRSLADVERKQNSRKAANERFAANKKLQTSVHGLLGAAGNALNGSANHELLNMIATRQDIDNGDTWNALMQNQNTVENAYTEAANQNVLSKNDAAINAEYALRNLESNLSADLNNIDPELYTAPGEGDADLNSRVVYAQNLEPANKAQLSGYIMPDSAASAANKVQTANKLNGNDYYSRLINSYTARKRA